MAIIGDVEREYLAFLSDCAPKGGEADIVRMFAEMFLAGRYEDRIPLCGFDTILYEMSFRYGRADIVVFHADGSASVIEVKDGTRGYGHVVAGIGQAGLYATQLGMSRGALTKIRKCLLWTSVDVAADSVIEHACENAKTIALPWGRLEKHLRYEQAVRSVILKRGE